MSIKPVHLVIGAFLTPIALGCSRTTPQAAASLKTAPKETPTAMERRVDANLLTQQNLEALPQVKATPQSTQHKLTAERLSVSSASVAPVPSAPSPAQVLGSPATPSTTQQLPTVRVAEIVTSSEPIKNPLELNSEQITNLSNILRAYPNFTSREAFGGTNEEFLAEAGRFSSMLPTVLESNSLQDTELYSLVQNFAEVANSETLSAQQKIEQLQTVSTKINEYLNSQHRLLQAGSGSNRPRISNE